MGLVAPAAWAEGPIVDLNLGQDVFLNTLTLELEGDSASTLGIHIPKPAGTLDLDLRLSDFGINDNQLIHGTPTVTGDVISWEFDKTFNPPVNVDGVHSLEHASGMLSVRARTASGFEQVKCTRQLCPRSIGLSLEPGSFVKLKGSGSLGSWELPITLKKLQAQAGVQRPTLWGLRGPVQVYARSTAQNVILGFGLTSLASSNGARVDFSSSAPGVLHLPPSQIVRQARSMGTVTARLQPNFTGPITVKIAAGGVTMERIIQVLPAADADNKRLPWRKLSFVPEALAGCTQCSSYIGFTEGRLGLGFVSGRPAYVTPTTLVYLDDHFQASRVTPRALTETGWMTGTLLTPSGATQAFRSHFGALNDQAELLGNFTPVAINPYGAVFGNRQTSSGPVAVMHDGRQLTDLPIGATSSQVLAVGSAGHVVGVMTTSSPVGFSHFAGQTKTLLSIVRGTTTVPLAVNQFGAMAGRSEGADGSRLAVRIDANGSGRVLGTLTGYPQSWATSINDLGWIVGTASDGRSTVGFLWTPRDGLIDLNQLVDPREGMVVTEALKVTNDKQIVIKARVGTAQELYVVGL